MLEGGDEEGGRQKAEAAVPQNRLYQELARQLVVAIETGCYAVGDRLPAERELASEFSVSRPTVREAIIALEVQGLVEVRVGSGAYVKQRPIEKGMSRFNVTAFELTEARLLFEGEAAALAATQITDAELKELEELVQDIAQGNNDGDGEVADREFHLLISRATRNAAIVKSIDELWELRSTSPECALLHEKARTAQVKPVVEEHKQILDALRSRDPARARAAMRGHLGAVIDHLLFATEERAVEEARRVAQTTRARYARSVAV